MESGPRLTLLAEVVVSPTVQVNGPHAAAKLQRSQQPARQSHPQRHARIESDTSALTALVMRFLALSVLGRATEGD
jgi:divalent metal cation (Fe/Co/Zn/Cd) transporter